MESISYRAVSPENIDFVMLCEELDEYLDNAIGGASKREKYKKHNMLDTMDHVLVAYDGETAVGCAALRQYSKGEIEVKRVFVKENYRRRNIGGTILRMLMDYAVDHQFERMILETGEFLHASVDLYSRFGFQKIPNYGVYTKMKESLCMGLEIGTKKITYQVGCCFSEQDLHELFASVKWLSADYTDRMQNAFRNAGLVVSAWQDQMLVGLAEVLDDGELNAYIHYLLVRPEYQSLGIGKALLEQVKEHYKNYLHLVLICEEKKHIPFYQKSGFEETEGSTPMHIRHLRK